MIDFQKDMILQEEKQRELEEWKKQHAIEVQQQREHEKEILAKHKAKLREARSSIQQHEMNHAFVSADKVKVKSTEKNDTVDDDKKELVVIVNDTNAAMKTAVVAAQQHVQSESSQPRRITSRKHKTSHHNKNNKRQSIQHQKQSQSHNNNNDKYSNNPPVMRQLNLSAIQPADKKAESTSASSNKDVVGRLRSQVESTRALCEEWLGSALFSTVYDHVKSLKPIDLNKVLNLELPQHQSIASLLSAKQSKVLRHVQKLVLVETMLKKQSAS
jgi:hypothetical protein